MALMFSFLSWMLFLTFLICIPVFSAPHGQNAYDERRRDADEDWPPPPTSPQRKDNPDQNDVKSNSGVDLHTNGPSTSAPKVVSGNTGEKGDEENNTKSGKPETASTGKGIFDGIDRAMLLRGTYVLVGITLLIVLYLGIKMYRVRTKDKRVRRYDILSAKQLQPDLVIDSDSEDDLYDDSQARLVRNEAR